MIITTTKQLRPRERHDHYPTPSGLCRAALGILPGTFAPRYILDPGAGTGVWGAAARERWGAGPQITGVELQLSPRPAAYDRWHCGQFSAYTALAMREGQPAPELIMGNPPYRWAEAFVRLSLAMLSPGGYLVQLLRTAFLEGQARARGFWATHAPISVDTCSRRPSFTGDGRTDATAYSIFVWRKGDHPRRYSGGWLLWDYGEPIREDQPFRPMLALPAPPALMPAPPAAAYAQQPLTLEV